MERFAAAMHVGSALVLAPLVLGIINRTKAFFAGRRGPPLLQLYFDLAKLLRKGAVFSRTTTWVFVGGPLVGLAAVIAALCLVPLGRVPALIAFPGDLLLLAYLLGLDEQAFSRTAVGRNLLKTGRDYTVLADGTLRGKAASPAEESHARQAIMISDLIIRSNYYRQMGFGK